MGIKRKEDFWTWCKQKYTKTKMYVDLWHHLEQSTQSREDERMEKERKTGNTMGKEQDGL